MSAPDTLVYLLAWPPDRFDVERYGFRTVFENGLRVQAWDLSPLLNPAAGRPPLPPDEERFVRRFSSYEEVAAALKDTASRAAFVDYMVGLADLDLKHEKMFRLLAARGARLLLVSAGALPLPKLPAAPGAALMHRLKQAADPATLGRFLATRGLLALRRLTALYPKPALVFGGRSEKVASYLARVGLSPELVVPIHSLDFDRFLSYRRAHPVDEAPDGTCVFLDEGATSHPDFALLGLSPLEAAPYLRALNALFDRVEKDTRLKVVVAAHPRSDYSQTPGAFGGRPIVSGRTVELVARSSLALTHASTALSFAVLFGKPLRLVLTPEMAGTRYAAQVEANAAALGLAPVRADAPAGDWTSLPAAAYEDYRFKYLQSAGTPERTTWEIVAEKAKGLK